MIVHQITYSMLFTVECYDAENANGSTALLSIGSDGAYTFDEGIWSEEDGVISLDIDEYTTYTTTEIDGVPTFTGVRYSAGMASGTMDIPEADIPQEAQEAALRSGLETENPEGDVPEGEDNPAESMNNEGKGN